MKRKLAAAGLIVALAIIAYSNSFNCTFQFDDISSITDNPLIKDLGNYIFKPVWSSPYPGRYFGYLTFALNYRYCGLDVKCYHIVNLAIHITNALLVYLLVTLTFKTDRLKGSLIAGSAGSVALLVSALFTVHPVETQAVTYIVQRLASLATLFYLGSLVFFIKARSYLGREGAKKGAAIGFYLLSLVFAVLAMKTKEISFTLPIIALLYELFFFEGKTRKRLLFISPMLVTILVIPVSMVGLHEPAGHLMSDINSITAPSNIPRWDYLLTQLSVIVTYIRLLFLPVNQNLDYDYPISHSIFEPRVLGSLLFISCILGAAVLIFMRSKKGGDPALRLISFGIVWFFVTLLVESSLIPIKDVIFEHRVYLPSIGVFIAVVCAGALASKSRFVGARVPMFAAAAVVLLLLVTAYARNMVWADQKSLWSDVARKSPMNPRAHANLGRALLVEKKYEAAIKELSLSIQLDPKFDQAYNVRENLGNCYYETGRFQEAEREFKEELKLKKDSLRAYDALGEMAFIQGRYADAVSAYKGLLESGGGNPATEYNLGISYLMLGRFREAEDALLKVLPSLDCFDVRYNLAVACEKNREFAQAIENAAAAESLAEDEGQLVEAQALTARLKKYVR